MTTAEVENARDLLLPGLWAIFTKTGIHAGIMMAHSDGLVVSAWRPEAIAVASFRIPLSAIADGSFKAAFAPGCMALKEKLCESSASDASPNR